MEVSSKICRLMENESTIPTETPPSPTGEVSSAEFDLVGLK